MTAWFEHWRIALGALRANWFRAVLTALGVGPWTAGAAH